ncbi:MAG: hypothetical protein Q8O40_06890, partial [Chloroflexota bacterium]|nr:hypothetical protein [Chloroflexota bacterium]
SFRDAIEHRRHIPDVLVVFQGLRTVIEGKVDDQPSAAQNALQDAQERVDKGIAHIGIAVVYPAALRQASFPNLKQELSNSTFRIAVCSEAGQKAWADGGLDFLADLLRRTFHELVEEDVVARAAATLDTAVTQFSRSVFTTPEVVKRASEILGIGEPSSPRRSKEGKEDAE